MSSSSGAETRSAWWRERLAGWRSRAASHGKSLGQLWSSSFLSTGANALALALVVSRVPQEIFAAYAAAQIVTFLASAWADGGVSGALQLLASHEGRGRSRWEAYRIAGFSLSWRIASAMALPLGALVLALHVYGKVLTGVPVGFLLLFALAGFFQARGGLCSSLVYATGSFGGYSGIQAGPPLLRFFLVAGLLLAQGKKTGLEGLLACDLASSVFGWWLAARLLRRQRSGRAPEGDGAAPDGLAIRQELSLFVRPSLQATVITSLSYAGGTLAGSFFAAPPAVAIYALFLKMSQMAMVAVGPLAGYLARRFRLAEENSVRVRKNRLLLAGLLVVYPPAAVAAMALYLVLGRWVHHYAFAHPWAFALFLGVNGLGIAYAVLDLVLASWGQADHRPLASWLGLGKVALLFALRPASAAALLGIDLLTLLAIDGWFLFRLLRIHRGVARPESGGASASPVLAPPLSPDRTAPAFVATAGERPEGSR